MSKGFGSRADMLSTKFDEVSRNSIWREHCEKEQAMAGLDQDRDFVITNPHSMTTIPEKPNNVKPQMKVSGDTIAKANETLRAMGAVAGLEDAKDGATEPLTSAQEYGFAHQPLVPRNPMFHHGRNTCNITDYAAQYYAMTKTTPFTRRDD